MITINLRSKLAQLAYTGWMYRKVSKRTGLSFDTMLIGFYGDRLMNKYLDFYIDNNIDFGIKEAGRLVIDNLVEEEQSGIGRLTK